MKCLLLITVLLLLFSSCKREAEQKQDKETVRIRESVLSYMSQPMFAGSDFVQQVTGTQVRLRMYDIDEKMLYFTISKTDFDSASTINMLTTNPAKVDFGGESKGSIILREYVLKGTDKFFFRFPKDNLKIDTSRQIIIDYGKYKYTISVHELADYTDNKYIYGGKLNAEIEKDIVMSNHGAFVGMKNEPSLARLVSQIIKPGTSKEETAQMLLEFISGNLKYSNTEAYGKSEVLKRPNEVLMTKNSDCSGLVILYASLLEQFDIDYRLVYSKGHISTAVEGKFPDLNKLSFELDGKKFFIAETTLGGFKIGVSPLGDFLSVDDIKYIQKPGKDSEIVKFKSKKPLEMN